MRLHTSIGAIALLLVLLGSPGCDSDSVTNVVVPMPLDVSGTWRGTATATNVSGTCAAPLFQLVLPIDLEVELILRQSGTTVTGTLEFDDSGFLFDVEGELFGGRLEVDLVPPPCDPVLFPCANGRVLAYCFSSGKFNGPVDEGRYTGNYIEVEETDVGTFITFRGPFTLTR